MTNVHHVTLEEFGRIVNLVEDRASLVSTYRAEKARLAAEDASLENKVQSERFYKRHIDKITEQLAPFQGKEILGDLA